MASETNLRRFKYLGLAIIIFSASTILLIVMDRLAVLKIHPTASAVIGHMCLAFMTATFVGVFYEFAGHERRMEDILHRLREESEAVLGRLEAATTSEIQRFTAATKESMGDFVALVRREADLALPIALKKLFKGTPATAKLLERTEDLLTGVRTIHARKMWFDDIALRFIGELLECASSNADKLASPRLQKGDPITLHFPVSAVVLADKILAAEMGALKTGDSYLVISDLGSWGWPPELVFEHNDVKLELADFYNATLAAVTATGGITKGVSIRRLFYKFKTDNYLTAEQAAKILRLHWDAAISSDLLDNGTPSYQVGFLTRRSAEELGLEPKHRGVFIQGDAAACFSPGGPHLSTLTFEMLPAKPERDLFEDFWRHAVRSFEKPHQGQAKGVTSTLDNVFQKLGTDWWSHTPVI